MRGLRGMFVGVLTLIALETIVSTTNAANRTAGLLNSTANGIAHLLDPNMAAIPIVGVPKSMRWMGHTPGSGGPANSSATYSTAPPEDRAPIVAPPPANAKPKPPKATVSI